MGGAKVTQGNAPGIMNGPDGELRLITPRRRSNALVMMDRMAGHY
jgi:hypothetical protein